MGIELTDLEKMESSTECGCMVVGDIILDKYISGGVNRISPEAPIPVLSVNKEWCTLGGAANVAANIKGLNKKTILCGVLGNDNHADIIEDELDKKEICFAGIRSAERRTTVKTRVMSMNHQLVRIDQEDTHDILKREEDELLKKIDANLKDINVLVISDYNKGVCTERICKELIHRCIVKKIKIIVDPKKMDWSRYVGADLITPNFKEYCEAIHTTIDNSEDEIIASADVVLDKYNIKRVLVTRSQYGMTLLERGKEPHTYQSIEKEVYDVSGAGDTVVATIAAMLSCGFSYEKAIEISNYAAGLAVSKVGTYTVSQDEVIKYIDKSKERDSSKIIERADVEKLIFGWRNHGEKIVFTNGCFDILHVGHVDYLNKARLLGTKMIIGLNSDSSVKRLKGNSRPINTELARAQMLSALQCVDAVVIFDEDTPEELIKLVKPDFLVKGGDYKIEEIAGREYAGEVRTIPLTKGYSTTSIIEKMNREET